MPGVPWVMLSLGVAAQTLQPLTRTDPEDAELTSHRQSRT